MGGKRTMNWIEEKKWQEILKNKLISVPKQKTHIRKPKSGTDMDKCKDKLVQLNEKLKNMDLSHTFDTIEASNEKSNYTFPKSKVNARYMIEKDEKTDIFYDTYQVTDYTLFNADRMPIYSIGIYHELFIEDIPEQVACKALKMLEKVTDGEFIEPFTLYVATYDSDNPYGLTHQRIEKRLWISTEGRDIAVAPGPFICDMGIRSQYLVGDATKWESMMHKELIDQWTEKMKSKLEWWK